MSIDLNRNHNTLEAMQCDEGTEKYTRFDNEDKIIQAEGVKRHINATSKCGKCCENIVTKIWTTRASVERKRSDKDIYIMTTLRELLIYLIFLSILMIIAFGSTEVRIFYYTSALQNVFIDEPFEYGTEKEKTFDKITNGNEFWHYLEKEFPKRLFWSDYWYNEPNRTKDRGNLMFFEVKLVGVARLRQVRSKKINCLLPSYVNLKNFFCYEKYNILYEETGPINESNKFPGWRYESSDVTQGSTYLGSISLYGGAGYIIDLAKDEAGTTAIIGDLKSKTWIDRSTRAIFVDFILYNSNLNYFCKIRIVAEFPNFGGVVTGYDIKPAKLLRYVNSWDYFVLSCEIIFLIYVVYYMIELILEFREVKWKFFKNFWNMLDSMVMLLSVTCIIFNVYRIVLVNNELDRTLHQENIYPHLDGISYYERTFQHIIAICVFFSILKIFKYISFNRTMTHLSSTIGRSMKEVVGFSIMFLIIFGAFAQMAYLLFGGNATDFREFHTSVLSQFRIILGDFNFKELADANSFLGEIYFVLYVFFVFFVLINMFLAIICDNYVEVKHDETINKNTVSMSAFLKTKTAAVLERMNVKAKKIMDIQDAINCGDANNDSFLAFDEWRMAMKEKGYADCEIEAVFAKYDVDGDQFLDPYEQKKMKEQLEGEKKKINETIKKETGGPQRHVQSSSLASMVTDLNDNDSNADNTEDQTVSREDLHNLNHRIDGIETNLKLILSKIDQVLDGMENIELQNMAKQKAMKTLVENIILEPEKRY